MGRPTLGRCLAGVVVVGPRAPVPALDATRAWHPVTVFAALTRSTVRRVIRRRGLALSFPCLHPRATAAPTDLAVAGCATTQMMSEWPAPLFCAFHAIDGEQQRHDTHASPPTFKECNVQALALPSLLSRDSGRQLRITDPTQNPHTQTHNTTDSTASPPSSNLAPVQEALEVRRRRQDAPPWLALVSRAFLQPGPTHSTPSTACATAHPPTHHRCSHSSSTASSRHVRARVCEAAPAALQGRRPWYVVGVGDVGGCGACMTRRSAGEQGLVGATGQRMGAGCSCTYALAASPRSGVYMPSQAGSGAPFLTSPTHPTNRHAGHRVRRRDLPAARGERGPGPRAGAHGPHDDHRRGLRLAHGLVHPALGEPRAAGALHGGPHEEVGGQRRLLRPLHRGLVRRQQPPAGPQRQRPAGPARGAVRFAPPVFSLSLSLFLGACRALRGARGHSSRLDPRTPPHPHPIPTSLPTTYALGFSYWTGANLLLQFVPQGLAAAVVANTLWSIAMSRALNAQTPAVAAALAAEEETGSSSSSISSRSSRSSRSDNSSSAFFHGLQRAGRQQQQKQQQQQQPQEQRH